MQSNQNQPFTPFSPLGKNGVRPYYAPGLGAGNYTNIAVDQPGAPYYTVDYPDDLIDSRAAARELINFTVLKFLTTAVNSPFEVSKTLLQVQYMPREDLPVAKKTTVQESESDIEDEVNIHKKKLQTYSNGNMVRLAHIQKKTRKKMRRMKKKSTQDDVDILQLQMIP